MYERRLARGKERLVELANEKDSDSEISEDDSSDDNDQIRPKQQVPEEIKVTSDAKASNTANTFDFGEVSTVVSQFSSPTKTPRTEFPSAKKTNVYGDKVKAGNLFSDFKGEAPPKMKPFGLGKN